MKKTKEIKEGHMPFSRVDSKTGLIIWNLRVGKNF